MKGVIPAPRVAYAHNLLDNSDFRNPINQRGQNSYTTAWGYALDRWYLFDNRGTGEEAQTLTIISGGIRLTGAHTGISQRIPLLDGAKTYTLAYEDMNGKRYCSVFPGSMVNLPQYGFAPISIAPGDGAEVVWAALYEGAYSAEMLPPYHPKGYAAELAECQRYYYKTRKGVFVSGYVMTEDVARLTMQLPRPMRATPAIQGYNSSGFGVCTVGGLRYSGASTLAVVAGSGVGESYLLLDWTLAGAGMTPCTPVCTFYDDGMGFSAEL